MIDFIATTFRMLCNGKCNGGLTLMDGVEVIWPLAGGALVGLAAAVLLVVAGRVMAIPGMIGSLLGGAEGMAAWSIAFIAGLVMAAPILGYWLPSDPAATGAPWPLLVAGGLALGLGARLAGTGPDGDGLVGLARLSRRSGVAVLCIAVAGVLTVLVGGPLIGQDTAPGGAS